MNIGTIILSTFYAIFKLFFVAFAGFLATKTADFDKPRRKGLSTIVFQYFVPCILFVQTSSSVKRITDLATWWWLPTSALVMVFLFFCTSWIIATVFRLDKLTKRLFVYVLTFPNTVCPLNTSCISS